MDTRDEHARTRGQVENALIIRWSRVRAPPAHVRGHFSRSSAPSHRLFIVYADCAVAAPCYLGVDPAPGHVAILGHADVGVAEVIGADPGRESFVIDECGDRLAEAAGGSFGDPQLLPRSAPSLPKLFGSRRVPVVEGKIIPCSPR